MDYSFFDGLIDGVFVINDSKGIVYCNESAAKLCDSSVRRLARGKPIFEFIEFSDPSLFVMPEGLSGKDEPAPYTELHFNLKSGKVGKVQVAIQPFVEPPNEKRWVIMVRDVTIEEVLHAKYHKQLEEKEVYIQQLKDAQKQLEDYSKNLEQMVEARTLEVKRANAMLNAIMNSLGQGFFVFDKNGICSNFYTRACEDILQVRPANKNVAEVLKVKENEMDTFKMWLSAIYGEQLPFDTIKELGPSLFPHTQDKYVSLEYYPLRNESEKIENVVVVATDKTSEYQANKALEAEKKYAKMVIKLVANKKQFSQFLDSAKSVSILIRESLKENKNFIDHEYIFRMLHTLEGESATYSAMDIWQASRQAQELLEPLKKGQKFDILNMREVLHNSLDVLDATIQAFIDNNAELFSMVGLGRAQYIEVSVSEIEEVLLKLKARGVSSSVLSEIEDSLLRETVESSFRHYEDVTETIAEKLNKKLRPLEFAGLSTRLYLEHYQELFSSLVHAYRNAIDHGIEPSEEREMMGKPPEGLIKTEIERFEQGTQWIKIKISDDGAGISTDKLKEKLILIGQAEIVNSMSESELMQQVFSSGVSTKEAIGEFSGRGIGMNAIKIEAERLGGRAWVDSKPGEGTQLIIEVPDLPKLVQLNKAA